MWVYSRRRHNRRRGISWPRRRGERTLEKTMQLEQDVQLTHGSGILVWERQEVRDPKWSPFIINQITQSSVEPEPTLSALPRNCSYS